LRDRAAGKPMSRNLLLDADEPDLRRQGFELISLALGERLVHLGDVPTHAYFPVEGVISIVSSTERGQSVEIAAVGREGMAASISAVLSGYSHVDLMVQVPGTAFRLDGARMRAHIEQSSLFRHRWLAHIHMLVAQMAQSAVCNRYHSGQRRLARWLLTVADRAGTDTIPLTHEFAAALVGGDRPRVSVALRALRERRLVEHRRGQLRIVDREGLINVSCECYLRLMKASQSRSRLPHQPRQ
jgi:CRP-like cAMP-binding protein